MRITMASRILSLVVVVAIIKIVEGAGGINTGFTSKSEAIIMECKEHFDRASNLKALHSFLMELVNFRSKNYLNSSEMGKCLGVKSPFSDAAAETFEILIKKAKSDRICLSNNLDQIVELDKKIATNIETNDGYSGSTSKLGRPQPFQFPFFPPFPNINQFAPKYLPFSQKSQTGSSQSSKGGLNLYNWWRLFVGQVVISCKRSLSIKFRYDQSRMKRIEIALKGAANLAQNFDWIETNAFINNEELRLSEMDTPKMELDEFVDLVPTSDSVTDVIMTDGLNKYKANFNRQPHIDVVLQRENFNHFKQMFADCSQLMVYRINLIDPLIRLIEQGYDYDYDDRRDNQAPLKYLKLWIPAIEMCQLTRHLTVLTKTTDGDGPVELRLKVGGNYESSNRDEGFILMQDYKHLPGYNNDRRGQTPEYPVEFDRFSELDPDLNWFKWQTKEVVQNRLATKRSQSNQIAPFVFSESFLQILADFFESEEQNDFFSEREYEDYINGRNQEKKAAKIASAMNPSANEEDDDGEDCPICLDKLSHRQTIVTPCHHKMHRLCLKNYAKNNPNGAKFCIMCRAPIKVT